MRLLMNFIFILLESHDCFTNTMIHRQFARQNGMHHKYNTMDSFQSKNDCECESIITSGKPSSKALSMNPREAIQNSFVYSLCGVEIAFDDVISNGGGVSLVVLLRSFG